MTRSHALLFRSGTASLLTPPSRAHLFHVEHWQPPARCVCATPCFYVEGAKLPRNAGRTNHRVGGRFAPVAKSSRVARNDTCTLLVPDRNVSRGTVKGSGNLEEGWRAYCTHQGRLFCLEHFQARSPSFLPSAAGLRTPRKITQG